MTIINSKRVMTVEKVTEIDEKISPSECKGL